MQSAVRVPRSQGDLPRGAGVEPGVLRGAGGVRGRRRRRGAGGPHGGQLRDVDADARVVGIHLAAGLRPPPPGALLHAHHQRVRQDAGGRQGHPGQLGAQHLLPLHRPVQLKLLIIWNHGMHWLDLVSVLSWIVLHGYVLPRRFLIKVKVGSSIGCHVGVVVHVCVEYVGGIWRRGTFACALPRPLSLYQCVSRP
ncbi:hypothetical protein VPH35_002670 [Triticum aestivum]